VLNNPIKNFLLSFLKSYTNVNNVTRYPVLDKQTVQKKFQSMHITSDQL
jgi:hypothetical protein